MRTIEIDGKTVTFGEKDFMNALKPDCLWSECPLGRSKQEARFGRASIRCCGDDACMRWAADFAVRADAAIGR